MVRRAAKVDGNQKAIVEDLRRIPGCSVVITSAVGNGFPDLVIGYRGFNFLVELKNAETIRGEKPETVARQKKFRQQWNGQTLRAFSFMDIINHMTGITEQ